VLRRRLKRTFYVVLGVTVFLFSVTLIGALVPGQRAQLLPENPTVEIGLIAGPIHYDLLLPLTPEIRSRFAFANKDGVAVDNPRAGWLLVGWGAREFYRAVGAYSDLDAAAVGKAITGDRAVVRLLALPAFDLQTVQARPVRLGPHGLNALLAHIERTMIRDSANQPVLSKAPGFSNNDAFYEAKGDFNIIHTCNDWISQTLRAAGRPMGVWTPTTLSVRTSLWWFAP